MKRALNVLKLLTLSLVLLYLGDYLSVHYGIPKREPLTTVQIEVYYAIRLKGQKTEFTRADPETETCVHSLFPQIGYLPCWYVTRHMRKWIEIGMLFPKAFTSRPNRRSSRHRPCSRFLELASATTHAVSVNWLAEGTMHDLKGLGLRAVLLLALVAIHLSAQEPTVNGAAPGRGAGAAIAGSKEDPAAVERGGKLYVTICGGCHGANARGGAGAPDLVRSVLVLDDEKGILIAPILRDGRPDQGMPKMNLTEPQITDIVAWLHVQTYAAGHRTTYAFLDVVTGDPKKGEAYFNSIGKCNTCHSVTGDLKGIGSRYEPFPLQSRWLQPRGGRGGGGRGGPGGGTPSNRSAIVVTVTLPSGQVVSGTLDRIDDFNVSLRDSSGDYHSFTRDGATPKVEVRDPLQGHTDLLHQYTDVDIHNVTAYLVTLK